MNSRHYWNSNDRFRMGICTSCVFFLSIHVFDINTRHVWSSRVIVNFSLLGFNFDDVYGFFHFDLRKTVTVYGFIWPACVWWKSGSAEIRFAWFWSSGKLLLELNGDRARENLFSCATEISFQIALKCPITFKDVYKNNKTNSECNLCSWDVQ